MQGIQHDASLLSMRPFSATMLGFLLGTCACGSGPQDIFEVELMGRLSSFEQYTVEAKGFHTASDPVFSKGSFVRRFQANRPRQGTEEGYVIEIKDPRGTILDTLTLRPFICDKIPRFVRAVGSGQAKVFAKEVHQALLTTNGELEVDRDFERALSYRCEVEDMKMGQGESLQLMWHKEPLCSDKSRENTVVQVSGTLNGHPFEKSPRLCMASLTDYKDGYARVQFHVLSNGHPVVLSLQLALLPFDGDRYPKSLQVVSFSQQGQAKALLLTSTGTKDEEWNQAFGTWNITTLDYLKNGRTTGNFSVKLISASGEEVSFSGRYDLPVLRVPITGDWIPGQP